MIDARPCEYTNNDRTEYFKTVNIMVYDVCINKSYFLKVAVELGPGFLPCGPD